MTYVLGLTGSIGMGKTTTSAMFAAAGVAVWDADATVHRLYAQDAALIAEVERLAPGSTGAAGVDRQKLKQAISGDPALLSRIEMAVAPRVSADRDSFVRDADSDIVLIDHPLLFESGTAALCDAVVVVSVDPETQRRRVLDRGTMTPETLDIILAKQIPDAEKRKRADFVIETTSVDAAEKQVKTVLRQIRGAFHA